MLVDKTIAEYRRLDIVVNNAALAINLPFEEQTLDHWDQLVNLNGRGVFLLTQAALRHFTRGSGRIVNIVSISSRSHARDANFVCWDEGDGGFLHKMLGQGAAAEVRLYCQCSLARSNND